MEMRAGTPSFSKTLGFQKWRKIILGKLVGSLRVTLQSFTVHVLSQFSCSGSVCNRPGTPIADGLLEKVAKEMGLREKLPVASGIPDGLAGCLALIGCQVENIADDITNRMCKYLTTEPSSVVGNLLGSLSD